jgi:hypothetical protein
LAVTVAEAPANDQALPLTGDRVVMSPLPPVDDAEVVQADGLAPAVTKLAVDRQASCWQASASW